jgi:hypothetical protein
MVHLLRIVLATVVCAVMVSASAVRADWSDNFDDGNLNGWTIENPYQSGNSGIIIEASNTYSTSSPYSLRVSGVAQNYYGGRITGPQTGTSLTLPYCIKFRFRYSDFHWYHMVTFGHVTLTLDQPGIAMRYATETGFGYLGSAVSSYLGPNQWHSIEIEVDPRIHSFWLRVDNQLRGFADYGSRNPGSDQFRCQDNCGAQAETDYISEAYYDDISVTSCFPDCNGNGIDDRLDISSGHSLDCNYDGAPDECQGFSDCNANGRADFCDLYLGIGTDCNHNNAIDSCEIADGLSNDCNGNWLPDECEEDCNNNRIKDSCDIAGGSSVDCNLNGIPDECETDCNVNGVYDSCDIALGTSQDCNLNKVPDECDIANGTSIDCKHNGVPDECDADTSICEAQYPGDWDGNCYIDNVDLTSLIKYVFQSGPPPWLLANGDFNGDCKIDTVDIRVMQTYLFLGGPPPVDCSPCLADCANISVACQGPLTGNVDCDPLDNVDISDLSMLIDFLYITFTPICCKSESNVDGDAAGLIDISDLSALIDFLYISFTPPAPCP